MLPARHPLQPSPVQTPLQRLQQEFGTWLTVAEVARLMKVSKMTVYRLQEIGDLGSVRVGRSIRITEASVRAYLAAGGSDQELYVPAPKRRAPLVSVAR